MIDNRCSKQSTFTLNSVTLSKNFEVTQCLVIRPTRGLWDAKCFVLPQSCLEQWFCLCADTLGNILDKFFILGVVMELIMKLLGTGPILELELGSRNWYSDFMAQKLEKGNIHSHRKCPLCSEMLSELSSLGIRK